MCQAATAVRNTGINIISISQTRAAKLDRAEAMSQKSQSSGQASQSLSQY